MVTPHSCSPGDPDCRLSIRDGPEVELKVRGSRFLARGFGLETVSEARERVDAVARQYHDARHHCWGSRFGPPGGIEERCDDDGEPAGSSGPPILAALRGAGVHDALVVVTRYFGGTRLGVGGLIRAYGEAARLAVAAAAPREIWSELQLVVACDYGMIGRVEATLARWEDAVRAVERRFAGRPELSITVRRSRASDLAAALRDATAGQADLQIETR
jgi:uncharacterized YigZ family protein